jgi:hypothetical protein
VFNRYYRKVFVIHVITILCRFSDSLFAEYQFSHLRKDFEYMQESSEFLLEIVKLVSSANIIDTDKVCSVRGR